MVERQITKIDAAVEQLDWAIRLVLDHQAYVPAITLGGAANELFHEMLGSESPFLRAVDALVSKDEIKNPWKLYRKAVNWLKHWQAGREETLRWEWKFDAFAHIITGIANVIAYDSSCSRLSIEMVRIILWSYAKVLRFNNEFIVLSEKVTTLTPEEVKKFGSLPELVSDLTNLTMDEASLFPEIQTPLTVEAICSFAEAWSSITSSLVQLINEVADLLSSTFSWFAHFREAFSKQDLQEVVERLRKTTV